MAPRPQGCARRGRHLPDHDKLARGLRPDWKPVGDGVSEFRLDVGPGYRIFYTERDGCVIILLCGGDKSRQQADIARAKMLAKGV